MARERWFGRVCALGILLAACPVWARAQQKPIAYAPTNGVTISGSLEVTGNRAAIGPNATITAGDKTARVRLARGGSIDVCRSTKIQLSADKSLATASHPDQVQGDNAIMIALDHGAFEAHDKPGKYSDVVMTPDLRILISGPGKTNMSVRVAANGDTCIANHGANAPYVTVSSLFDGGAYRVRPNQRVLFEHGDLSQVVDNEPEPCGCPPPPKAIARAGLGHGNRRPDKAARANPFPLAESEGLKPPPPTPTKPVVPVGQVATEVEVPLTYSGSAPTLPAAASSTASAPHARHASPRKKHHRGFFGSIGHFFARLFGHK